MSFAIEVPGDANPLSSLQDLGRVLESALSPDPSQRQASGQQLKTWEQTPGFYMHLQTIFLDKTIPIPIRLQAIIQLKNGIDKHWRLAATTKGGIQDQEKANIRERLFRGTLDEEEKGLALQNSLAAARIIRIDYPRHWPQALPQLIEALRTSKNGGNPSHLYGALQILLQVVKEMSTARLRTSQTALYSVTPEIVYVLGEIYAERTPVWEEFFKTSRGDEDEADMAMLSSLLTLRILRRLLISGYDAPYKDKTVQQIWSLSQTQLGQFLKYVSRDSSVPAPYQDTIGRHVLQFTKLHVNMATAHPASFAALPDSLPLVNAYWTELVIPFAQVFERSEGIRQGGDSDAEKSGAEGPLLEKLTTRALLLIKACLDLAYLPKQTFVYRGAESKEEEKRAVELVKNQLFTDEFSASVANTILTHLFVFRRADLEAWEEDPEDWEHHQRFDSMAFEYEVRPCAEKVFISILQYKKELLIPSLISYIETATTGQADFATKDAVYTAMGLAAMHLNNMIDFNAFLASTLVPDAQQNNPLAKVLRRRVAILLGQWVFEAVTNESRATVYQMFRHFLNPADEQNDLVVQLTAARNLQAIVDELDFNVDLFAPHAADILQGLTRLAREVTNDETRLMILETIRLVVSRLDTHVAPLGDSIMEAVAATFESSAQQDYMVKTAIVGIFSALVTSMGPDSQRYHPMMVPLIVETAQPTSELHTALIDEVLCLWDNILMQSNPPVAQEIVNLAPLVLPILTYASETAGTALETIESYIMLAPQAVLEDSLRRPFLEALSGHLEVKSREQVKRAAKCIEYMIRAAQDLGGAKGVSVITQDLLETGFTRKAFEMLHDAWEARQTTGPNRRAPKLNTVAEADYFAILARLLLADPAVFVDMVTALAPLEQVWPWLISEWFSYMESWDLIQHKKLTLLALTRLLELQQPVQDLVLGKLQDYFVLWADVVAELQDGAVDAEDNQITTELEATEYDNPKIIRERELYLQDPVHRVVAKPFVREQLQGLVARAGGDQKFQAEWMANVDKDVVEKMSRFV
ncbi:armadillo-type protein, partial [Plectosphaerella plurivora]